MQFNGNTAAPLVVTTGDPVYVYPNFMVVPAACTVKALNVSVYNYYATGTDTTTISLYHGTTAADLNAAAPDSPSMSCSVTSPAATSCSSTASFDVSGGDLLSIGFKESNNLPYNRLTVSVVCQ
jgi:hypothetical protein